MRSLNCDPTPTWFRRGYRRAGMVLLVCGSLSTVRAEQPAPTEQTTIKTERYLGVVTEPISEALAAQLKDLLPDGRGLLVTRVLPESPAGKAGVQPFDVIVSADSQPLASPEQLKSVVTSGPAGHIVKLESIRGAKVHVVDVQPGERTASRLILRHLGHAETSSTDGVASKTKPAAGKPPAPQPAYSVSVQTRDGRSFQVEVRLTQENQDEPTQKFSGTAVDITSRLKTLPESIQRSVTRQMGRLSEDRQTLRTVQFRFQPRRDGDRQVLTVTLRKPESQGTVKSFEWQQPMGDATQPMPLEQVLHIPDFAAQLQNLDPAIREKIESTLKTASLPAATVKVEQSQ